MVKNNGLYQACACGSDGGVPSMRATKSISSIEQKLLKLIESMPVLNPRCHSPRLYACA